MRRLLPAVGIVSVCAVLLSSCSTGEKATGTASAVDTEANLELRGHQFYAMGVHDSAEAIYRRLLKIAPENKVALRDLGNMHFELAVRDPDEKSPMRKDHLRVSRRYFSDLERLGEHDIETYDRLCEISLSLGDNKSFLSWARKSADRYPFDRQYNNLGLAYFNAGDYQNAIKTEKEAIEKFRDSPYLSTFYRQLGRAYMKVDRDQTAEKTFEDGLRIVNARLQGRTSPEDFHRLTDDRVAILTSLKHLYQTYHKDDKLRQVERQLLEAGQTSK